MQRRRLAAAVVVAGVLAAGFAGGYWYGRARQVRAPLPVLGRAPGYVLVNQLGKQVDSDSFRGKVQVVTFLFPYCTDYCPLIAAHLVSLERALEAADLSGKVQLVAFDVDPGHTGPATVAKFMRQYGWDPEDTRWQFLTGDAREIRRVVTAGFHVDYEQVPESLVEQQAREAEKLGLYSPPPQVENPLAEQARPDYDVTHNDALVLVDGRGRIRRIYEDADRLADDTLVAAVQRLLAGG